MIIFDDFYNKNSNASSNSHQSILSSKEMIDALIENVSYNCKVTISVGFARLDVENEEMTYDWKERANNYLNIAKKNGKNRMYYGQDLVKIKHQMSRKPTMIDDNKEDDLITWKSLHELQVKCCKEENKRKQQKNKRKTKDCSGSGQLSIHRWCKMTSTKNVF